MKGSFMRICFNTERGPSIVDPSCCIIILNDFIAIQSTENWSMAAPKDL